MQFVKNKIQNPKVKVRGITLSSLAAGIRYKDRHDICLIKIEGPSKSIVRFTSNRFPAAPIIVSKKHLNKKEPKYLLINAGNANAATGQKGIKDVINICGEISKLTGCEKEDVVMFSTGVIGELLPTNKIISCLPKLIETNIQSGWSEAAKAIMTTDTFPKMSVREFELGGQKYSLAGICKGSGMIQPKMATMLAFVATDLPLSKKALEVISESALSDSFNKITVDGETSTNDSFVLISTNTENTSLLDIDDPSFSLVKSLISECCQDLALNIVEDGEGASKLVNVRVNGADSYNEAKMIASSIANSLLVKTAIFAEDPNWGRIFSAVGASGAENIKQDNIDIFIGDTKICHRGRAVEDLDELEVIATMRLHKFNILIELNIGSCFAETWTCDLSYDYIKINAEYRS